jgi:hypothetical protein
VFTAGQMGDAYLAAAAFERDRLTQARSNNDLTIEVRREVERVLTDRVLSLEAKARLCYKAAGLDLDSRVRHLPIEGVVGLTTEEATA